VLRFQLIEHYQGLRQGPVLIFKIDQDGYLHVFYVKTRWNLEGANWSQD